MKRFHIVAVVVSLLMWALLIGVAVFFCLWLLVKCDKRGGFEEVPVPVIATI